MAKVFKVKNLMDMAIVPNPYAIESIEVINAVREHLLEKFPKYTITEPEWSQALYNPINCRCSNLFYIGMDPVSIYTIVIIGLQDEKIFVFTGNKVCIAVLNIYDPEFFKLLTAAVARELNPKSSKFALYVATSLDFKDII